MTDTTEIQWPEEVWLRELDEFHNGWGSVVLSEFGTTPRFEGCPETDREFQRYVDGDIYDSAARYWTDRDAQRLARIAELESVVRACREALEALK